MSTARRHAGGEVQPGVARPFYELSSPRAPRPGWQRRGAGRIWAFLAGPAPRGGGGFFMVRKTQTATRLLTTWVFAWAAAGCGGDDTAAPAGGSGGSGNDATTANGGA